MPRILMLVTVTLLAATGHAEQIFEQPRDFLGQAFSGQIPAPEVVWLTGERMEAVSRILGHRPKMLRMRYWGRDGRTAWIINEIGKEQPITIGIVVDRNRIERVAVLVYRESIGWEVRYRFFTDQFRTLALTEDLRLSAGIDGISGATLSVGAVTNVARLALYLHGQTLHGR